MRPSLEATTTPLAGGASVAAAIGFTVAPRGPYDRRARALSPDESSDEMLETHIEGSSHINQRYISGPDGATTIARQRAPWTRSASPEERLEVAACASVGARGTRHGDGRRALAFRPSRRVGRRV